MGIRFSLHVECTRTRVLPMLRFCDPVTVVGLFCERIYPSRWVGTKMGAETERGSRSTQTTGASSISAPDMMACGRVRTARQRGRNSTAFRPAPIQAPGLGVV